MHIQPDIVRLLKVKYLADKANIDNVLFKAHYKLTSAFLLTCCTLLAYCQSMGDSLPIDCFSQYQQDKMINTYCWISKTFTLPNKVEEGLGQFGESPGVSNYIENEDKIRYHSYYQWVPIILFFQGILFYIPHFIWKMWEDGKIMKITKNVRGASIGKMNERISCHIQLVKYLVDSFNMHNYYASGYFLCEVFNFLNVVGNFVALDYFLDGEFYKYGINVLGFNHKVEYNSQDSMKIVFPRLTKCILQKYGPSGTIQTEDFLCVLTLNIVNEKIFLVLWFWYIILTIISSMALVYTIALMTSHSIRKIILLRRFKFNKPQLVTALIRRTQFGDFFLLHLLGQNLNMIQFTKLLDELSVCLQLDGHSKTAQTMELETSSSHSTDIRVYRETEA